jgi:hypothetical protein
MCNQEHMNYDKNKWWGRTIRFFSIPWLRDEGQKCLGYHKLGKQPLIKYVDNKNQKRRQQALCNHPGHILSPSKKAKGSFFFWTWLLERGGEMTRWGCFYVVPAG